MRMTDAPHRRAAQRREWIALAIILALSALPRIVYLRHFLDDRAMLVPVVDAVFHDYWARALVTGDWFPGLEWRNPLIPDHPFLRPPGYPYFLALIYAATRCGQLAVIVVQMAMGLLNAALAWRLGRWLFGRAAGLIAAAMMGFYWLLIYFESEMLDATLTITLALIAASVFRRWLARPRGATAFLAGAAIGVLALVRANFLPLAVVTAALVAIARGRKALAHAALILLGAAAAIAPATIRNMAVDDGEFVLISANGGMNLYIGNNPQADVETPALPGAYELLGQTSWSQFDYLAIVRGVERKVGRRIGYAGASRYFTGLTIDYVREHPGQAFSRMARRAARMFGPVEYSNNKMIALERADSPLLRRMPGNFTAIFVLALAGVLQWAAAPRPRTPNKRLFVAFALALIAVLCVSYLPFILEARFRVPIVPFLVLFASACVANLAALAARRRFAPVAGWIAFMAALYGLLAWPASDYKPDRGYWHLLRATQYQAAGDMDRYRDELEKSFAVDNRRYIVAFELGRERARRGDVQGGLDLLGWAVRLRPASVEAHVALGTALLDAGRLAEAQDIMGRAVRLGPTDRNAVAGLAAVLRRRGAGPDDIRRAVDELSRPAQAR